jgi:hypothetical protein
MAEGSFTADAWAKGIIFIISGFTAVRTMDRFGEKIGKK